MSDNKAFEFHVKESERGRYYLDIRNHLRRASIAKLYHDEDAEREEVAMMHDLLSEVMGR